MSDRAALHERLAPAHTALLVIDLQNDFVDENGFAARRGRDVSGRTQLIGRVNDFIVRCRARHVPVVFLRAALTEATASKSYLAQWGRWDVAVAEGSWGAELSRALTPPLPDEPITKAGYDSFIGTDLDLVLRNKGSETLLLAGVNTNVCVETTARHAHGLGYHVAVLGDLCAAGSAEEHALALRNIDRYFGNCLDVHEVLSAWATAPPP